MKKIPKDIQELISKGIIDDNNAIKVKEYYDSKKSIIGENFLLTILSLFGVLVISLGLFIIFGHSWSEFSYTTKLIVGYMPLILGNATMLWVIHKGKGAAWKESVGVFNFFAIELLIMILYQTTGISYGFGANLIWLAALSAPMLYLLDSKILFVLYNIVGIMYAANMYQEIKLAPVIFIALQVPYIYKQLKVEKRNWFNNLMDVSWVISSTMLLGLLTMYYQESLAHILMFGYLAVLFWIEEMVNKKENCRNCPIAITSLATMYVIFMENAGSDLTVNLFNSYSVLYISILVLYLGGLFIAFKNIGDRTKNSLILPLYAVVIASMVVPGQRELLFTIGALYILIRLIVKDNIVGMFASFALLIYSLDTGSGMIGSTIIGLVLIAMILKTKFLYQPSQNIFTYIMKIMTGIFAYSFLMGKLYLNPGIRYLKELTPFISLIMIFVLVIYLLSKEDNKNVVKVMGSLLVMIILEMILPVAAMVALYNIWVVAIGVLTLKRGSEEKDLIVFENGILMLAIIVITKLFDFEINFIIRGISFIIVGIVVIGYNIVVLKRLGDSNEK
ncbi:MAG: DUF2157 domain-containing protein [Clostridia bacterium]|jgi:hypothetical protein|nr:DUF2157 domain-containing protein [Clostridia bacterium]